MKWEELNAKDFEVAVKNVSRSMFVASGSNRKAWPHLPLGTDLFNIRKVAILAAEKETAIVFPPYYFTQIYEAQHCAGTIAIKPQLIIELLENVCDEISRNKLRKIILVNGHGGNRYFLPFFLQTMLYRKKEYIVYLCTPSNTPELRQLREKILETEELGHACEWETSSTLATCSHLVKMDYVPKEPFTSLNRLKHLSKYHIVTPVDWYACYPEHYVGDARAASKEKGEKFVEHQVQYLVEVIKTVRRDDGTRKLYDEFFSGIK